MYIIIVVVDSMKSSLRCCRVKKFNSDWVGDRQNTSNRSLSWNDGSSRALCIVLRVNRVPVDSGTVDIYLGSPRTSNRLGSANRGAASFDHQWQIINNGGQETM